MYPSVLGDALRGATLPPKSTVFIKNYAVLGQKPPKHGTLGSVPFKITFIFTPRFFAAMREFTSWLAGVGLSSGVIIIKYMATVIESLDWVRCLSRVCR